MDHIREGDRGGVRRADLLTWSRSASWLQGGRQCCRGSGMDGVDEGDGAVATKEVGALPAAASVRPSRSVEGQEVGRPAASVNLVTKTWTHLIFIAPCDRGPDQDARSGPYMAVGPSVVEIKLTLRSCLTFHFSCPSNLPIIITQGSIQIATGCNIII